MDQEERPEELSATGKPMTPATPRDVVHIRIGSFVLIFAFVVGVLGLIARVPALTWLAGIAAVITVVDILLAVRRRRAGETGEAG